MPKWLHSKLKKQSKKKGLKNKEAEAYIYGTLEKHEKEVRQKSRSKGVAKPR